MIRLGAGSATDSSPLLAVDYILYVVDVLPGQLQDLSDVMILGHLCNSRTPLASLDCTTARGSRRR